MEVSTILKVLLIFIATSAIECAKSFKKSEICPCVPLNICANINRFNKEDAKYFTTVLKCTEAGYVRCCPHNDIVNRRSDNVEDIILIDDVSSMSEDQLKIDEVTTTEINELTTVESDLRSLESDFTTVEDSTTTEIPSTEINIVEETTEVSRKSKFIDNNVDVIYPNHKYPELDKKKQELMMEHLFLIFPNGEIEAALATSTTRPKISSQKPRRVIVRKRLIKKPSESFEGAESKISQTVIGPQQMDIEEVKKRLADMYNKNRRKNDLLTTTTTENSIVDETTKKRRKKIKFRKRKQTTTAATTVPSSTTFKPRNVNVESSTIKSRRKIVYDTSSRTNFLKQRPSPQQSNLDDEESIEPEVTAVTTTQAPAVETTEKFVQMTTPTPPKIVKQATRIDFEHKKMIETLVKTLSAIYSGVDMKFVERMIETHKKKMKDIRKNPPTTTAETAPTRPYRGSAKFRSRPATTQPAEIQTQKGTRTRNLSRTRNTQTTHRVTVRKSPRIAVTQPPAVNPIINSNSLVEEVDMPPKQKKPIEFRPSPLYGITMDQFSEFDSDMIEKVHETLQPRSNIQNGFFPVIQNGTPSTLL